MKKYSANYCSNNNNFIININMEPKKINDTALYSTFCVVQNILQRGNPTKPSKYLIEQIGEYWIDNNIRYHSTNKNIWDYTIKGDSRSGFNPARVFLSYILPRELKDLSFITDLIIPEIEINEIINVLESPFNNNFVDFYLPQLKLVIEIDGVQHNGKVDKIIDRERDMFLKGYGINTVRISTKEIKDYMTNTNNLLSKRLGVFYAKCKNNKEIQNIQNSMKLNDANNKLMIYDSILRFQVLILELLKAGILPIDGENWILNIKNNDIRFDYKIAIFDLMLWIENILKLQGKKIDIKDILIEEVNDFKQISEGINIDFSLLKKWDDTCFEEDICFIRADYLYDINYFEVSTSELIKYKIIPDGEDNSNVKSLYYLNENIFGFTSFNNGQLSIIINALSKEDTIGLLPTGGGKSLTYQFCCLLQPTINFVVVPIKSLMYDQKLNLDKKGIVHTNFISSDQEGEEKESILNDFSNKKYFYLWISPERFQTQAFRDQLSKINTYSNIGYAVIDEVHCLSEWGHDFRTSYLNLAKTIRQLCPGAMFLGLTATASKYVLKDILIEFEMTDSNVKTIVDYTRPELEFKVIQDSNNMRIDKENNLKKLLLQLDRKENIFEVNGDKSKCGLIFTPHVKGDYGCYGLYTKFNQLERFKNKVNFYSGEVPWLKTGPIMKEKEFNEYKNKVQKDFQNNQFPLLLATKAFGMGVDKGNIRYTIHYGVPSSVESFYQEAGRAGRDKQIATCYVLHSKDCIDSDDYEKIFNLNTTIEELNFLLEKYEYPAGDILRNLFLSIGSNRGVEEECILTYGIYSYLLKEGKDIISINDVKNLCLHNNNKRFIDPNFNSVQKAIYRLSLLGVIKDWTVEGWNQRGKFKLLFGDFSNNSIKESLKKFINKYDTEFNFNNLNENKYKKYEEIYNENTDEIFRLIKILIQWNYDNIFYNRRQSQKSLVDLCEAYFTKGELYFKEILEGYFKITDETFILDYIANNPNDIEAIYNVIFDDKNYLKPTKTIEGINASLIRYLESYRYNTALNYLSGVCSLILDKYDSFAEERFIESFKAIANKDIEFKERIFEISLRIGATLGNVNKESLSKVLNEFYDRKYDIYKGIEDNLSLQKILEEQLSKLARARKVING